MSDILFFQGSNDSAIEAAGDFPAQVFVGRCLWISADNVELAAHVAADGREEIQSSDPRYSLAIETGNLLRSTIKAAGLA
jgi:hypothetical protein